MSLYEYFYEYFYEYYGPKIDVGADSYNQVLGVKW